MATYLTRASFLQAFLSSSCEHSFFKPKTAQKSLFFSSPAAIEKSIKQRQIEKKGSKSQICQRVSRLESLNKEDPAKRREESGKDYIFAGSNTKYRALVEENHRIIEGRVQRASITHKRACARIGRLQKPAFFIWFCGGFRGRSI